MSYVEAASRESLPELRQIWPLGAPPRNAERRTQKRPPFLSCDVIGAECEAPSKVDQLAVPDQRSRKRRAVSGLTMRMMK